MQLTPLLPVNVITGFLGSGKTTLLNRLVRQPSMADSLVVINEFGDIGLDHRLMTESNECTVVEMSSGCLCCTIRGDLSRTLQDASEALEHGGGRPFTRVIIETTGLADPAPILQTLMTDAWLSSRFHLDSVICLVDAASGFSTLQVHRESWRQVVMADRLLITKTDLADEEGVSRLANRLSTINPAAEQLQVEHGELQASLITGAGLYQPASQRYQDDAWLRADAYTEQAWVVHDTCPESAELMVAGSSSRKSRHGEQIKAFYFTVEAPISPVVLEDWLDLLISVMGDKMLRVKAIVHLTDRDEPLALHGVQHIFHSPSPLPIEAATDRVSQFVFITHGISANTVSGLFHFF